MIRNPACRLGQRVAASLLDFLIILPLAIVAFVPVVVMQRDALGDYLSGSPTARAGMDDPLAPGLSSPSGLPLTVMLVELSAAYTLGFWRRKQATSGKLVVGLQVLRPA